ncbi:hypothetical protein GGF42_000254 [Coemansia sp. RSA 2424]|nr:hypothetical protein GGF42_000254 [Coemansia sp. RSA 2424]
MEDHINVAIRVRPLNQRELRSTTSAASTLGQTPWHIQNDTIIQRLHADGRACTGTSFTFDKVFDQRDTTQTVYDNIVRDITISSMGGFNGTIFAYGQTSSGKTHTMYGSGAELGIIKLAVKNMFDIVASDVTRMYRIRVSFLEIYNEILRDLLEPSKTHLVIREKTKNEIYVAELSEHVVTNANQVEAILAKGDSNRQVAGTNMNERSSRSHTVFSIIVESCERAKPDADADADATHDIFPTGLQRLSTGSTFESGELTGAVTVSSLNLVDLAGSERVGQTGAEGQRLKEGAQINKSLLSLSTVIARLAEDGGDRGHIPYRDSKLTRILQPSLGGNAKTLIICMITPSPDYIEEALSTLKFASRAKTIQNKPKVNQELRGDALLGLVEQVRMQDVEIAQLKEQLEARKGKTDAEKNILQRQLYRSEAQRANMHKAFDKLMTNTSQVRAIQARGTVGTSNELRRQTWVSGQQGTRSENSLAFDRERSAQSNAAFGGLARAMDVDEGFFSEAVTVRSRSRAGLRSNSDLPTSERASALENPSESSQQQLDEANAKICEMGLMIQSMTRDQALFLAELGQLAAADAIPLSPAKAVLRTSPQELVLVRRKLRKMVQDREDMIRQCEKFRSQRPEAEFLDMELQSTQITLSETKKELDTALRVVDELKADLAKSEESRTDATAVCKDLQDKLAEADASRASAQKLHGELRAQSDQERCAYASNIRKQKEMAEKKMRELESEKAALQVHLDEHVLRFESFQQASAACESELRKELGETRVELGELEQRAKSLDSTNCQQRMSLVKVNAEAIDLQGKIGSLSQELQTAQGRVSSLELQLSHKEAAHSDLSGDLGGAQAKVRRLEAELDSAVARNSKLTALATNLKTEKTAAEISISELREEISSLKADATKVAADRQSLQCKIDELSQLVSVLTTRESTSAGERDAIAAELSGLKQELEVARQNSDALARARAAHDDLAREHGLLRSERDAAARESDVELEKLSVQISELNSQLEAAARDRLDATTDYDSQLAMLRDQEAEAVERARQLETKLTSVNAQLSRTQARLAEHEQSASAAALQDAELRQQIAAHATARSELEAHMATLRDKVAAETRKLSESEHEREHLLKKLGDAQAAHNAQVLKLEEAVASGRRDHDNAERKHQDAIAALKAKAKAGWNQVGELQKAIAASDSALAQLREQLEQLIAIKDASADELLTQSVRIDSLLVDVKEAEDRASMQRVRAETAEHTASETRQELQAQVDELCAQKERGSHEMAKLQQVRDVLTADLQRHKDSVESFEALVGQSESASSATIADLRTQLAAATSKYAGLKSELDMLHGDHAHLSAEQFSLSSTATGLRNDLTAANAACRTALEQLDEQKSLAESYTSQIKELESAVESHAAEIATAKAECVAFENRASGLQQTLDAKTSECARLASQMGDEIEERNDMMDRLAATEKKLREDTVAVQQHLRRIGELEEMLNCEQLHSQESVSSIQLGYASERQAALHRIESLNTDIASLRHQLFVQHSKCDALEKELADSRVAVSEAQSARGLLADENDRLRADYEALASRVKSVQADMELAIAEAKSEFSSKCIEVRELEAALEYANTAQIEARDAAQARVVDLESQVAAGESRSAELRAAISNIESELSSKRIEVRDLEAALEDANTAQIEACNAAQAKIDVLESQVAAGESRSAELQVAMESMRAEAAKQTVLESAIASEHASLSEATAEIQSLEAELDQARQSIVTLKSMMTELAQIKDGEIIEMEDKLAQHEALLEAAMGESQEKDELVRELEKQAAEHLSRAVGAEAEMDKALAQTSLAIEELTTERDSLEARLAEATLARAQLEAQAAKSGANVDRLQVEIKRYEQAAVELQLNLDRASSSLADAEAGTVEAKQAHLDLLASVSAELLAAVKSLSELPGCAQIAAPVVDGGDTSCYRVLLNAIQELTAAAVAGAAIADIQTTAINGESAQAEQDVLRLQTLNEKLEKKNAKLRDMYKSDMTELHAEEEKQRQRAESLAKELVDSVRQTEAAASELARVRDDLETQSKRRAELEAAMARQQVAHGGSPVSDGKAVMARSKRAYLAVDDVPLAVATLSPISSSTLNSRLSVVDEQQQQQRYPARKRTAPASVVLGPDTGAPVACASDMQAAAKADPLRARSNYGDRRRLRRNQHMARPEGLEEQAAEQCVQQ